jgi:hypothetical protein
VAAIAYEAPQLTMPQTDEQVDDQWAVIGAVAGFLGVGVAIVAYICSVCSARSFWSCVNAVHAYFSRRGC